MSQVSTPALILHGFPYGDTSKILRLLTPEYGLRSVIAKGAHGPRSRFGALLEPFTEGEAQFNLREGHDLFILTGFSLSRSRQALGRDLTAFSGASLLAEVALRFGTEEASPELFDLLVGGLNRLADPQCITRRRHDSNVMVADLAARISTRNGTVCQVREVYRAGTE